MDKFVVKGGKSLSGTIEVRGSKNAALPIMAACILSSGTCAIENVPRLRDTATMVALLQRFGATVEADGEGKFIVDAAAIGDALAPYELVRTMRASFFVLGPLLARLGWARVSLPGGCAIGARPGAVMRGKMSAARRMVRPPPGKNIKKNVDKPLSLL